jgi:hypothetical protein
VFELLTREYELAKIQEARETPTAQVLDPALVPSKKSSPHRLIIALCGTLAIFACACIYVVAWFTWERTDSSDRRKRLVRSVVASINARIGSVPLLRNLFRRVSYALALQPQADNLSHFSSADSPQYARTRESA